ncbi:MAG: glycoside hydrolase family 13 protein [Anaerolineae bacterium]
MPSSDPTEFLLGHLSTDEGRAQRARSRRVGLQHADLLQPIDPQPGEAVMVSIRAGVGVALQSATLHYTTDGTRPDADSASTQHLPMQPAPAEWDTLTWAHIQTWSAAIPGQPSGAWVRYHITAITITGEPIACPFIPLQAPELAVRPERFDQRLLHRLRRSPAPHVYEYGVDELVVPDWLSDAVIYQIFVDRFAPASSQSFKQTADLSAILGGTLRGITSRMDYLSDLGVNCLWLTPIFASPSHHGYDPTDYFKVEPRLGTEADFRDMVDAAHRRGIRVVLDFVANHMSRQHPAFVSAQTDPASPTRDWFFFRRYPDEYEAFYDVKDQPVVNTDQAEARSHLIQAAQYWLNLGVDGYRLDHAHGATHAFWSAFRAGTRASKPTSVTFGEITDPPDVIRSFTGRMDGALDFYLMELLRSFFVSRSITASTFARSLEHHFTYFGDKLVLPSFLDNHDMNRFLWSVGGDTRRLKLAALCQFTLPGTPIVYYGTEVGLSQRKGVGRLEESRLPMPWENQDTDLLDFYRRLIALRKQTHKAWSGPRVIVEVDDANGLLVVRCGTFILVLNNHVAPTVITASDGELLLATNADVVQESSSLRLPAYGGAVVRAS